MKNSSRGKIVTDNISCTPTLIQSGTEKPVQLGCQPCNGGGKVIGVFIPTNTKARNNFERHLKSGDISKIKEQIKRGSVKYFDTNSH